jgi:hypothetical protein
LNNNNDKALMIEDTKKKKGGDGTTLAYNFQNHFQWQEVGKWKKNDQKNVLSCSSLGEGKQVLSKWR